MLKVLITLLFLQNNKTIFFKLKVFIMLFNMTIKYEDMTKKKKSFLIEVPTMKVGNYVIN